MSFGRHLLAASQPYYRSPQRRATLIQLTAVTCFGIVLGLGLAGPNSLAAPAKAHPYTPAGGADQMANKFTGKVGQTIFTGKFRFTVTGIETGTTYAEKYVASPATLTADDGQKYVVVHCRIKNGTPTRQEIALSTSPYSGNDDTTLTDDQEQTYQPINYHDGEFVGYDVHPEDTAPTGAWMLPGAAADFAVVFSVPAAKPQAFIFGILKYDRTKKAKQTDIRISLP